MSLMLAGCTVGPDYHLPERALVNSPKARQAFHSAQDRTQPEPPDGWWQLFDDATLAALVRRAFEANTDLRMAEANLKRSHALLVLAQSTRQPQASLALETSYTQASAAAVLSQVKPDDHPTYNVGISISYDLDLFGGLRRGIEAAKADAEAVTAARDLARVNVAAEVTRAYADICNAGNELATAQHSLSLQQEARDLTGMLADYGRAVSFDVDRQQALVEDVSARIPALEARQLNAAYRLATLTGAPPGSFDHGWLKCRQPLRLGAVLPVGDGAGLLRRRPDVRAAERRLAAATARIGVEAAALYPSIKLGASLGSTGPTKVGFTGLSNRYGIGPSISWNLNPSAARARVSAAEAQTQALLAAFDGTVLVALREVETALNSYTSGLQRLERLKSAETHASRVQDTTAELRRGGRVDALVALDAERARITAEQSRAAAESEVSQNLIAVFLALGGGWNSAEAVPR